MFVIVLRPELTERDFLHARKIFGIDFGAWMGVENLAGNGQFLFEFFPPLRRDGVGVTDATPFPGKIDMVIGFD